MQHKSNNKPSNCTKYNNNCLFIAQTIHHCRQNAQILSKPLRPAALSKTYFRTSWIGAQNYHHPMRNEGNGSWELISRIGPKKYTTKLASYSSWNNTVSVFDVVGIFIQWWLFHSSQALKMCSFKFSEWQRKTRRGLVAISFIICYNSFNTVSEWNIWPLARAKTEIHIEFGF